jgi:hypothetical protein
VGVGQATPTVAHEAGVSFVRGFAAATGMVVAFLLVGKWGLGRAEKGIRTRLATLAAGDAA